jgi:hypothetical protein
MIMFHLLFWSMGLVFLALVVLLVFYPKILTGLFNKAPAAVKADVATAESDAAKVVKTVETDASSAEAGVTKGLSAVTTGTTSKA